MDRLEHALEELQAYDTRLPFARIRALRHRTGALDAAAADQGAQRLAAAYVVVEALAVLAAAGGRAADVRALIGEGGHVHDWGSECRSCSCGQRPPGDARQRAVDTAGGAGRRRIYPALVHDTTDEPDPRLGPARPYQHPEPGRYPAGAEGDALAFADLEHTDDD